MEFDKILPLAPSFCLELIEGRLVPPDVEEEVEAVWQEEAKALPQGLFNGNIVSFINYQPTLITGFLTEYRYFFAQRRRPHLASVLQICPIATSGRTWNGDQVLVGRRSAHVLTDPLQWELAPSGTLSGEAIHQGMIDYRLQVMMELEEETGIAREDLTEIKPLGVLYTSKTPAFDICVDLIVKPNKEPLKLPSPDEYTELLWMPIHEAQKHAQNSPQDWVPLSRHLLAH